MDMWNMREQKFLYQLSCKISEIIRKQNWNGDWRPFWILLVRNLSLVIIVCDLPFCFIFMVQLFCIFWSLLNNTKLLKFKMAAKRPFLNFCSQKGIRSLADIAENIFQIKRISDGNCFLKRASEHFSVSDHSNERVNDMGIKMSPKQFSSCMGWLCWV